MKNILLVSDGRSKFMSLIDLAILLKDKKVADPLFYFDDSNETPSNELEICKKLNIPYFYFEKRETKTAEKVKPSKHLFAKIINFIGFKVKPYLRLFYKTR